MPDTEPRAKGFRDVLWAEIGAIRRSRKLRGLTARGIVPKTLAALGNAPVPETKSRDKPSPYREAGRHNFLGLAFSGGGIRSATFNLGVLQALAKYGLIPRFDYLSTVSGGGYIGSWLTSWFKRTDLKTVVSGLKHKKPEDRTSEPPEITYLRRFSNYLTPKTGALSADTWTGAAIYVRNVLLNLTILVMALSSVLLLPRLVEWLTGLVHDGPWWGAMALGMLLVAVASWWVFRALRDIKNAAVERTEHSESPYEYSTLSCQGWVQRGIVVPGFVIAWLATARAGFLLEYDADVLLPLGTLLVVIVLTQAVLSFSDPKELVFVTVFVLLSGCAGAALLWRVLLPKVDEGFSWVGYRGLGIMDAEQAVLVWGIPLTVLVFSVMVALYIGLMGTILDTDAREWWGRLSAWMMVYSFGWVALFLIAFGARGFVAEVLAPWGSGLLASGWIGATIGGLFAGHSGDTGGKKSSKWLEVVALVAPYVFIVGLLVTLSYILELLGDGRLHDPLWILGGMAGCMAVALLLSWRVSINDFSMYNFYRNRLTRCYLGASNMGRNAHPFTGFDPHEDGIRMHELVVEPEKRPETNGDPAASRAEQQQPLAKEPPYEGPYFLVNTALNLVGGEKLAWQKRMAMSFFISPLFSGFDAAMLAPESEPLEGDTLDSETIPEKQRGYFPTPDYQDGIPIGAAATISGAAASPSMGYHSSAPLAFLMTVFNVRLGRWIGNPVSVKASHQGPELGLPYLLFELFGMTNAERDYVYLSDGGHFENLGIYELVRRRCRFIVACDAEEDGQLQFDALGNAIEKCRTDFGINIRINVDPIRRTLDNPKEGRHCAVGTINYGPDTPPGRLLYIKSSMNGDEPTDVLRYRDQNPAFPHQSTLDQSFDETQFESYRALGYHITQEVLSVVGDPSDLADMQTEDLFVRLDRQWHPPAGCAAGTFTQHAQDYEELSDEIRKTESLRFLDTQINPSLRHLAKEVDGTPAHRYWLPDSYHELRAGYYVCSRMIQLMESVYLDLDLDREWDHPDNQGWMNLFKNWSWAGMLRTTWAITSSVYGARFRDFCERRLELEAGRVCLGTPVSLDWAEQARIKQLDECNDALQLNFVEVKLVRALVDHLAKSAVGGTSPVELLPIIVRVDVPFRPDEKLDIAVGFALTHNDKLMYLRIQDQVRGMGLARKAVRSFIEKGIVRVGRWPATDREPVVMEMPTRDGESAEERPRGESIILISKEKLNRFRNFYRTVRNEVGYLDPDSTAGG